MITDESARDLVARIQSDPVFHIREIQGVKTLESYQERIARAVYEHERVAVAACHDVGKTFTMSKIVLAIGSSFPGAKIITTAPTALLVEKLLWSEIRNGHRTSRVPLGGRMLTTQWQIREDWFAIGISPAEEGGDGVGQGTTSTFQGFHGELVVIVFDEATGVSPKRWMQAEGMMTSHNVKWVAIGNPTSSSSEFAKCFKSPDWHKIYLSCFDSPNLIANGITNVESLLREIDIIRGLDERAAEQRIRAYQVLNPKLITLSWVVKYIRKLGIDHPLVQSKVLGQFPAEDDHVLMPLGAVEAAMRRDYTPTVNDRWSIGVDVARFGSDKTVITVLHGLRRTEKRTLVKKATTEVAGEVISIIRILASRNITVVVDETGVGGGVVDSLREGIRGLQESMRGIEIRGIQFGSACEDEEERVLYANQKAKILVKLSKDLRENLSLPDDSAYLEELPTILFRFDSKGRYVIESKDEYKKRTGRPSPDDAESLALANEGRYAAGNVGSFTERLRQSNERARPLAPSRNSGDIW